MSAAAAEGPSSSALERACAELLEALLARRLSMLRDSLAVGVVRFELCATTPRLAPAAHVTAFYEVCCVYSPRLAFRRREDREDDDEDPSGWATPRRYSEFKALHASLCRAALQQAHAAPPALPGTRVGAGAFFESVLSRVGYQDETHLERRRSALDAWLKAVLAAPAGSTAARKALSDFLDPSLLLRTSRNAKRGDLSDLERFFHTRQPEVPTSPRIPPPDEREKVLRAPSSSSSSSSSQQEGVLGIAWPLPPPDGGHVREQRGDDNGAMTISQVRDT